MEMNATHRLLVMRSGETDWDAAGRVQGATDLPLAAASIAAVQAAVAGLGRPPIGTVICGPDEASQATAGELAAAAGVKVTVVPELGEMSFGLWEGILRAELDDRFCRAGRQWGDDPSCVTPPEGESLKEFAGRLLPALRRAVSKVRSKSGRRAVHPLPAVAVVLRPVGDTLVRSALGKRSLADVPVLLRERPSPTWIDVDVNQDWSLATLIGGATPVAAA